MEFPFEVTRNNKFDALGFGTNAVDHLICVSEYPAFDSKVRLNRYMRTAGGEAASTMVALRRLGMKTAYAGTFGDDAEGEFGLRSLVDEGVDTSKATTVAGAQTQLAFIIIDERSGERTIIWDRDRALAYSENDAPVGAASQCSILHMTPHDTRACIGLAKAVREHGAIVSVDIDNVFDGIDELLPLVDICIASFEFPSRMFGIRDPRSALFEIRSRYGCAISGLTLGASGSLVLCEDTFIESGAFEVPGGCVDTTGAGDAFRAGFLYGVLTRASCGTKTHVGHQ